MIYKSLKHCVNDLERQGHLLRISDEVDPNLEMAEIHRRVVAAQGPALLFTQVKGSPFPAVSNLFGTLDRARFMFRGQLDRIKTIFALKADPASFFKAPLGCCDLIRPALCALPRRVGSGPVLERTTMLDQLPQIRCWPEDGGGFVLLPQVYTENCDRPGIGHSNLGMYRIQLSGNDYEPNRQVGMHYQIKRDIGVHHSLALAKGQRLRVSIFIGGPPAHTLAAVMYLPEHLPEVAFAGALAGRRFRYAVRDGFKLSADADFCITGWVPPDQLKPEGPFGDHLGYYSLAHDFPYLEVEQVYHRRDAVWPFTVVGRPPQEDSTFGKLVQEIAGPVIPREIPGINAVHAVDAAGVHPLLLAIGAERYAPYENRKPRELLTLANALLGYGPCSLAKYLLIVAGQDNPELDVHDIEDFFGHLLERVDWTKDLHFQTSTTIDTLDYSGAGLNEGSKLVIAAAGAPRRQLATRTPARMGLPKGFSKPALVMPGVVVIQAPNFTNHRTTNQEIKALRQALENLDLAEREQIPLMVLADDSKFVAAHLNNFLWVTFTRSNPSHDVHGLAGATKFKHWGCCNPLIIDARIKPHHAPPLVEDPKITRRVDALAAPGGCLHGII